MISPVRQSWRETRRAARASQRTSQAIVTMVTRVRVPSLQLTASSAGAVLRKVTIYNGPVICNDHHRVTYLYLDTEHKSP